MDTFVVFLVALWLLFEGHYLKAALLFLAVS